MKNEKVTNFNKRKAIQVIIEWYKHKIQSNRCPECNFDLETQGYSEVTKRGITYIWCPNCGKTWKY